MVTSSLLLIFAAALPSLADSAAVELQYKGTLTPRKFGTNSEPVKRFTLHCLYVPEKSGGTLSWVIDEEGGGGWPWPERFGQVSLAKDHRPSGKKSIQLLHTHQESKYPLKVRLPLFDFMKKLEGNGEWTDGKTRYEVIRRRKVGGRDCRQVEASGRIGRTQTVYVPLDSPIIVQFEQVVFMGRGDRFSMNVELESAKAVDTQRLAKLQKPLKQLLQLQVDLKRRENQTRPELSATQLQLTEKALKALTRDAEDTPYHSLVTFIRGDLQAQQRRSGDVAVLAKKAVGKPAPKLDLKTLTGDAIDAKDHKDKIVVLHFWEYRGDALEEPYGQVGYLDYLNSKRKKLGVRVYGVAVDPRLAKRSESALALRSIRKLRSFMNLGYPVTLDGGDLLKQLGDPRKADAKLPLWVVIDHTGTVRLYKAGFYKIRPEEGLKPLDDLLIKLIREQRKPR